MNEETQITWTGEQHRMHGYCGRITQPPPPQNAAMTNTMAMHVAPMPIARQRATVRVLRLRARTRMNVVVRGGARGPDRL